MSKSTSYIDIVMNEPPGPNSAFIEVENDLGYGIKAGEWSQRSDGCWVLRIKPEVFDAH